MLSVVVLVSALIVASFIWMRKTLQWLRARKHFVDLIEDVAGEPTIPILGNSHQLPLDSYEFTDYLLAIANKHASRGAHVLRFCVGSKANVVPLDGRTVKDIVDSTVEITKGPDYDFFRAWTGEGLLNTDGEKWRSHRKMLTPTFHFRMLDSYQGSFNEQARTFLGILEEFSNGETVDLFPYLKRCALDIICETAMGTTVNAQFNHNHSYVKAVHDFSRLGFVHGTQPWYQFAPLFYAVGYGRQRDEALKTLKNFTASVIAERKASKQGKKTESEERGRKAFLDLLLDLESESKLTDEEVREEVDTFMFAGHDTTSSGISFTLWALASHPQIQNRVAAEMDEIFGDSDRDITKEDLSAMKYTEMCIKEALRLFPPAPMVNRKIVHGDFKLGDKMIPVGATCSISPLIIHRNPQIWPRPFAYNPDNFLPENVAQRHPYDFIPFSAGLRNCIGQRFAVNEEKTLVAWVMRRFRLEATMPFEANRISIGPTSTPLHGVPVRLYRRQRA